MNIIPESELIINARGAIYHLDLRPEEIAQTIFTVGDPGRVAEVSKQFDSIEFRASHREFITHTGYVGKKRVSVVSTGIGTDNIDIVLNELDALANIDFTTRTIKPQLTQLRIMRIGTCGSLQADIPIDAFVASTHGLGIDNLLNFYRHEPQEEDTQLHHNITYPYISRGSASLSKYFVNDFHHGITVSCPGFYGPQGRILRMGLAQPNLLSKLTEFRLGNHRICNFEMETSAIYGLGKLLGHQCLSLNAVVANRVNHTFSTKVHQTIEKLITIVLEKAGDW